MITLKDFLKLNCNELLIIVNYHSSQFVYTKMDDDSRIFLNSKEVVSFSVYGNCLVIEVQ